MQETQTQEAGPLAPLAELDINEKVRSDGQAAGSSGSRQTTIREDVKKKKENPRPQPHLPQATEQGPKLIISPKLKHSKQMINAIMGTMTTKAIKAPMLGQGLP